MSAQTIGRQTALVVSSLLLTYFYLYYTSYFGLGLAPDSLSYLSMARHLQAGRGISVYIASQHVKSIAEIGFSPLYPIALKPFLDAGLSMVAATWILSHLVLFINLYLIQTLALKVTRNLWLSLLAAAVCTADLTFAGCHVWVLAEGLLILLTNLSLLLFLKALESGSRRILLVAAISTSLMPIAKYIGFAYAFAWGLCLLIYWKGSFKKRLAGAFGFGLIALLPMILWLIRNYIVHRVPGHSFAVRILGSLYQHDISGRLPFWRTVLDTFEATGQWLYGFVPSGIAGIAAYPVFAGVLLFLMFKGIGASKTPAQPSGDAQKKIPIVTILLISCVVYSAILILSLTTTSFSVKIPTRYLVTCYIHLTVVALELIRRGVRSLDLSRKGAPLTICWVLLLGLCLAGILSGFASNLSGRAHDYATKGVDESRGESWSYLRFMQWFPPERTIPVNFQ